MFNHNIFIKGAEKPRKIIVFTIIFSMLIYFISGIINVKPVYAYQERQAVSSRLNNYPGYAELINKLRQEHPNWNFIIFYTGLDWNQVIKNETTAWHGRNLVQSNKTGDWICPICNDKKYDNGSWRCASEATVSYYMDPRNFLNNDDIFQFEESVFNSSIHNINGIMSMTEGSFLAGNENAEAILQACQNVNINPYQVVSRLLQEQGKSGSTMSKGNNGWYNVFNVGATGNSSSQIIANATQYAKDHGWNTLAKSILGGIDFLKSQYIGKGQNTFYLQKFDVDDSDVSLYYHQYMQNVSAAYSEGLTVKNIYKNLGVFNNNISFVIPVYENMPQEKSPIPGTQGIVTQNVKITGDNVNIRSSKSTNSDILATLKNGETLLRIEVANVEENGYYWDKVVLADGRKGYVANNYIQRIDDITNCSESVIANTSVNLRNGPGTSNTSVITTLIKGQALTRIETGKYNGLDGYNWDRVMLADGRQGYLVSEFLDSAGSSSSGSQTGEIVKVITSLGLYVRENPGTSEKILTLLNCGDTANRVEKNVSNANGLVWDKIVMNDGTIGYIARGNSSGSFIEVVSGNNGGNSNVDATTNNNFKIENDKIITEPNTTVGKIKEKYSDIKITKNGQELSDSDLVGTGCVATINEQSYTIIKMGDVNGDGEVKATDYMKIKNKIMGISTLSEIEVKAADVNGDGEIKATDYMKIKNKIMGTSKIEI